MADTHRRELARLVEKEASLRKELSRHQTDEAKAREDLRSHETRALRSSSASLTKSYTASAERARRKAVDAGKKVADVTQKLADNSRDQASKRRSLDSAERSERQAQERQDESRRRKEKDHARELTRLSRQEVRYVHVRPSEPERLRVLYLTSNPQMDLRTDAEFRQVQQALRGAKFRDRILLEQRPAATFQDLLDGLNDVRPHVIHFSGHGESGLVQFEDGDIEANRGSDVAFDLLAAALAATDAPPTLLVLSACDTHRGATTLVASVPVVIGMSDRILDLAAAVFAQQFYAAIASGQSVGAALKQGQVKIKSVLSDDDLAAVPQPTVRPDVNIDELILVRPQQPEE